MTGRTTARVAGVAFLVYIVAGIADMLLHAPATAGGDIAARLGSMRQHETQIGVIILLQFTQAFCALILGVTLFGLTRGVDPEIARMGMVCRLVEGVLGALAVPETMALRWLAAGAGGAALEPGAVHALAAYLLHGGTAFTATFFAAGSACFAWLLLRGRMIPLLLARVGVVASVLLVVVLPLQAAGFLHGAYLQIVWLPMLLFEVPVAVWLIVRGVRLPGGASLDELLAAR